jgi:hypothetical protein
MSRLQRAANRLVRRLSRMGYSGTQGFDIAYGMLTRLHKRGRLVW